MERTLDDIFQEYRDLYVQITDLEERLPKLERESIDLFSSLIADQHLLEGVWDVQVDRLNILFKEKKIVNRDILLEYLDLVHGADIDAGNRLMFWMNDSQAVVMLSKRKIMIQVPTYYSTSHGIVEFLTENKMKLKSSKIQPELKRHDNYIVIGRALETFKGEWDG